MPTTAARVSAAAKPRIDPSAKASPVQVSAYLADIADWDAFNEVYRETFSAPYPTRTTIACQLHGALVEINAVAYVGNG